MLEFICPHCGRNLTEQARAELNIWGQVFTLWLPCACGQKIKFRLAYTIALQSVVTCQEPASVNRHA